MGLAESCIAISGILWGVEMIPQIVKTLKCRNVEDISLTFFLTCSGAYVFFLIGNVLLKNWLYAIIYTPSMLLNWVMVHLIFKFKK